MKSASRYAPYGRGGWLAMALLTGWLFAGGCGKPPTPEELPGPSANIIEAMNRGVSLMGQYQYESAVQAFQEVVQAEPDLIDAKVNLAIALFNRNRKEDQDLEAAERLLGEVLEKEPGNPRALYFKGIVLQHVARTEEAVACFEAVVKQRPEDGVAWYLLGLCKQRIGQPAQEELLKSVQCRPYLFSAYYKLSQLALRAGQEAQAMEYLEKFKQLRESPLGESVELPQYNQMGDLALARALPTTRTPPISKSRFQLGPGQVLFNHSIPQGSMIDEKLAGMAVGDITGDGLPDIVVCRNAAWENGGPLTVLVGRPNGSFQELEDAAGLNGVTNALACAMGDYDNDEILDLFIAGAGFNQLFRGLGAGGFSNVTAASGLAGMAAVSPSALFLDADHDADLDIFVCNSRTLDGQPAPNELWNNNGDGTFTNIALRAGVACADSRSVLVLPGDLDGDRDMDLVVLNDQQPARVFANDLLGQFSEVTQSNVVIRGGGGGALQDLNGDGLLDLLALGGNPPVLELFLGDGRGGFEPSADFAETAKAAATWGPIRGLRAGDLDLDGDLDVAFFGKDGHLLLNDGRGRFVLQTGFCKSVINQAGLELLDVTADRVPDLLTLENNVQEQVVLRSGKLDPPSTALSIQPTGMRGRDKRTRSPASGFGVSLTARIGLREQRMVYTGQSGGLNQSWLPVVVGLGGASKADYIQFLWPDGVAQVEIAVAADQLHRVAETQRKLSSCPVLFAWNGERFGFVTDFAGVGGLGYFSAPGIYAPPQVLEHVKIEPEQLQVKDGFYELRITEPMEEVAYIDRLELLAIDHRENTVVYPDERLAIKGPPPTHELLPVEQRVFPVRALASSGVECVQNIRNVDRLYAYAPQLDRRYLGFCQPHTLELDFGDRLSRFTDQDRVFLFLHGFIEYPYSQTVYAASQSRLGWEPIRIERQAMNGQWQTIILDGGAPGGMARMMTIELTGQLESPTRKLRLTTNLEVYYDQIFIGRHAGWETVQTRTVPLKSALLRRAGFAREYSPDGRMPFIYDYELTDTTAPFHVLKGAYTRYGPVEKLLEAFDDQYALVGPGDEIALRFEAETLPPVMPGMTRSFVLVSHAYCKDMDLYTATPETVTPLPFREMSQYPYTELERYPDTPENQAYLREYNTRIAR